MLRQELERKKKDVRPNKKEDIRDPTTKSFPRVPRNRGIKTPESRAIEGLGLKRRN
jgi:hypothetical protein